MGGFPKQQDGVLYLTEGGQETEVMYRHGFELPEFCMLPLLDDPDAVAVLEAMYESYLAVAARHGMAALIGGLDYRASPGWASRLGYSASDLIDRQCQAIEFLRRVAAPYEADLPQVLIAGAVGPWGDAYDAGDGSVSPDEAEDYHGHQITTLADLEVDLVEAMTLSSVPEAVGIARAAASHGLPASVSFTLDATSRLMSGPTLREAIEAVDAQAGPARPAFYGVNCSHPHEFLPALEPGEWFERVRCLRPNASTKDKVELCTLGHLEEGDPTALGSLMGQLAARYPHIDIWGGCCGTWDVHLDQIASQVLAVRDA
ncbi:MAG: homocysteine S-methyltransferase family protein [Acidimicrobiales bacterium]